MELANEIQADYSVVTDRSLVRDDEVLPWVSSSERKKALDRHVLSLEYAIAKRNLNKLSQCISSIVDVGYTDEEVYWCIQEIEELYDYVDIYEANLLYTPQNERIILPELVIPTREKLISLVKANPSILYSISPREFEELVADIFQEKGFSVELTKSTRDGGKDIIAVNTYMGIDLKYIIECKRYAKENRVSLDVVQRLYGVKFAENANKAILVTTSDYTRDARHFASQHCWDLSLKDRDDLLAWLAASKK